MSFARNNLLRLAVTATLFTSLTTGAFAHGHRFYASLNCNHEDSLSPSSLTLEVAGAGFATHMVGPVVCVSEDYIFQFQPDGTIDGAGVFKLRDCNGDLLVLGAPEIWMKPTPEGRHFAEFGGEYTVLTERCTGRFAGATGRGLLYGWADNDAQPFGGGQGFAEMCGTLVMAKKACPPRK